MTIIADRQLHSAPPRGQVRPLTGGPSFAARIEAGDRAKTILQERALGFSETGLLGLHYAHDSLNKGKVRSTRDSELSSRSDAMAPNGTKFFDKAATPSTIDSGTTEMIRYSGQVDVRVAVKGRIQSAQKPESSLPSLEFTAISVDETPNELKPIVSKIFKQAISQSSPGVRFALKIVETSQGISVVYSETAISINELQEFTDLSQQIAKDFGVTIRRLVVNGKSSI
jgi:hypothetical protein